MEVRHQQWRSGMENTKPPAVNYGYRPERNGGIPPRRTSSTPDAHYSDIVEKDSRSAVSPAPFSAHQPMFIPRSPFMDAEKDMTRTPTTPKSPPVPVAPSPLTSQDGKMPPGSGGGMMMPRGAHVPAYHRSSTTSNTTVSSISTSSSSGGSGHAVSQQWPPPRSSYGYSGGGAGMGMERPLRSHAGSSFHCGQHGDVGGVAPGPDYHYHYHKSGQQTYDPRFRVQPQSSAMAAAYGQPAKPYSSYPTESYGYTAHHAGSRYSRPLSTGSLSSASSSVSSRPGFSSLDEFPNLFDHRSTFAPPHGEGDVHRATAAVSSSSYHQFYDVHPSGAAGGGGSGFVGSPLSPLSSCDEHQPLLSLQQQSSLLLGDATSDELGGQLTNEMSRKLSLQDQRTTSSLSEVRSQRLSAGNIGAASCIHITEHPKDLQVFPNERAVLRCTARIISGNSQNREKEAELGEEPNLLWYKDAEPLIGEIDSEYVVEEMSEKDVGFYYCLVSHPENDKIQKPSDMARLTVKRRTEGGQGGAGTAAGTRAPEILEQPPRDVFAVIDEKLQIPLKAAGSQLRYRWYKDNKEMRYADGPLLLISSARYSDSGVYCCSVSNELGSVLSNNSLVKVTQVRDSTSMQGSKRPTSLYDWGDQPLSDSFLRDVGTAIARQTTNLDRIGLYLGLRNDDIIEIKRHFHVAEERAFHLLHRWKITGKRERSTLKIILTQAGIKLDLLAAGSSKKPAAANPPPPAQPPRIITHPKSTQVIYGQGLSLSVQLDPSQPLLSMQYQWYRNDKLLGGKTGQSIVISSVTKGDAGDYYCAVSNGSAQTTSKVARVEVVNPHVPRQLAPQAAATSSAFVNASGLGGVFRVPGGHGEGRYNAVRSTGRQQGEPGRHANHPPPPPPHGEFLSREACTVNQPSLGSLELDRESMVGGVGGEEPGGQPVGWDYLTRSANREGQETAGTGSLPSQQQAFPAEKKQQLWIVEHPKSQQVEAGDPLTLTCSVAGAPPTELSYTWYFNGLSLAGENRPKYEINFFTDEDEGLYQCRVRSSHGEVMSQMAHIEMKEDNSD